MAKRFFKVRSCIASVLCIASLSAVSAQAFSDVSPNAYYKTAVDWAASEGITLGSDKDRFSPDKLCSRAQTVTFLWRANGSPAVSGNNPFTDVAPEDYFYQAVLWAVQNGVTSGTSATEFSPYKQVTRAQVATFLHRAVGSPNPQSMARFADVSSSAYYANAVSWAAASGITTGTSAFAFSPDKGCTRAEIATFLYRSKNGSTQTTKPEPAPEPTPQVTEKPVSDLTKLDEKKEETKPEIVESDKTEDTREPHETPCVTDAEGAYNAIYQAIVSCTTEVDLRQYHVDWNTFYKVCNQAIDDAYVFDPDGPYRHFSFDTTRKTNNEVARLTIEYEYLNGADVNIKREQYKNLRSAVKIIVGEAVTDDMSDYDKAKALHDYLVLNNEYDMRLYSGNMPHISYTAYGAILEHTSVCAGYAYAYKMLLEEAGIPVEYVRNSNHAWDIVQIDGEWYHVDTTWDDPTPDRKGYVRYDYFLRSDSFMSRDHSGWTASRKCTSTKYDNTTVLNDEEQKQQEEQEQYNALVNEILAQMQQQLAAMPYQDTESLRNAETLTNDDVSCKIYIPADKYEYGPMQKAWEKLTQLNTREDFVICGTAKTQKTEDNRWYFSVFRKDIQAEIQRRQDENSQSVSEQGEKLILELQRAIKSGEAADYVYSCPNYSEAAIKYACDRMNADDYSFEDYTHIDYMLFEMTTSVEILNHRWEQNRIKAWKEVFEQGIRNRETRITVDVPSTYDPGFTPVSSEKDFISWGANNAFYEGNVVDGMVAGKDFRKVKSGFSTDTSGEVKSFFVEVEYLDAQS